MPLLIARLFICNAIDIWQLVKLNKILLFQHDSKSYALSAQDFSLLPLKSM